MSKSIINKITEIAAKYTFYGPDYNRSICASYRRLNQMIVAGHSLAMISSAAAELRLRLFHFGTTK